MSSASTPAPNGPTAAERASYLHAPRPFKNPDFAAKASSRKMRSLKQILTMERDAAMGIETNVGKKKTKKQAGPSIARAKGKKGASAAATPIESGTATPIGEAVEQQDALAAGDETLASEVGDRTQDVSMADVLTADGQAAATRAAKRRDLPTYSSFEAPPSLRPRKKFCDITGLLAPYTDPKTGLRYHSVEIYEIIKTFGPGVDQAYLALRGDSSQIK